jgi:RimJ/RimL family protein N-acetyltransferase
MIALVDYDLVFLEKSWFWLNDPEIKSLTMTPSFTKKDQQVFFESLPDKKDYWIKGVTYNNVPVGAMGLKHITKKDAEYWGYIGEKEYWGKGIGSFMLDQAINKAVEQELENIHLRVTKNNKKARDLYIHKGFKVSEDGDIEKYTLHL